MKNEKNPRMQLCNYLAKHRLLKLIFLLGMPCFSKSMYGSMRSLACRAIYCVNPIQCKLFELFFFFSVYYVYKSMFWKERKNNNTQQNHFYGQCTL